ncbi:hypothetical protein SAMN05421788_1011348 [Filimonas lacunae]|uniref:Pyridoxamine 5'-phosphate oxidase n=1 Tax=Filimonas lacunae TaxID=477680 RepID=A0A173MQF9_9BACT|nr:hypothetical protein [Filimonas lacunae]BAV09915.1 hypothetical protein FLA_5968 [Filimonas lacunae]SIS80976.1 hypothetical protein SAMN05421788_1011348 [Filimonas lacunae]
MDSNFTDFNVLDYREKIAALDQAIFYVYDDNGSKQPISLITHFDFDENGTLFFCCSRLPLTVANWNTFDAELQFHKKGMSYTLQLSGIATVEDAATRLVYFKALDIQHHGDSEKQVKHTYLHKQWLFLRSLLGQQQAASF